MISDWLTKILGWLGTAALLLVAGLAYFIWRFNPVFKVPDIKRKERLAPAIDEEAEESGAKLFVDESFNAGKKGNSLKGAESALLKFPADEGKAEVVEELKIIEKEPDEEIKFPTLEELMQEKPEPPRTTEKPAKVKKEIPALDLEIKEAPTDTSVETPEHEPF